MSAILVFIVVGVLFIVLALTGSILKRLPLTTSIVYLLVGLLLGPHLLGVIRLDPIENAAVLERLTEVAVIISLFTAGLKLRMPFRDGRWRLSVRLAFGSMAITVGLITLVGVYGLDLPLGAAVLLGAILAPTDPVLASDVQVENPADRDRLRFSLTGEAGLNDGTAFPFVMLGLGLLGLHGIGENGWRWVVVDLLWATAGGLVIGALLGWLVGRLVLYIRCHHQEAVGWDEFLALGLIALSYGIALLAHAYGFLAVFAAGLALRRVEMCAAVGAPPPEVVAASEAGAAEEVATNPDKAPSYMAQAVLGFNERLERIGEVGIVMLLGSMLSFRYLPWNELWFIPVLLLVIRPLSVALGLAGSRTSRLQRRLIGWFGIRGIGSLYYLMYAIEHGLPPDLAHRLTAVTVAVVTTSVVIHGLSVTPLMNLYARRMRRGRPAEAASPLPAAEAAPAHNKGGSE